MPHGISNHDIIAKTFSIYTQRRWRNESSITHNNTEEVMAVRYHVQCTATLAGEDDEDRFVYSIIIINRRRVGKLIVSLWYFSV